jgi:hypothetical protein
MNRQSAKLPALSHMEFRKKVTEVTLEKVWPEREEAQVGADAKNRPNGKPHLIQARAGKVTQDCTICSNREMNRGRRGTSFVTRVQGCHDSTPTSVLSYIIKWRSTILYEANRNVLYVIKLYKNIPSFHYKIRFFYY